MKKMLFAVLSICFAVTLSAAEIAVNFKDAIAKAKPGSIAPKGWYRNGNSRKDIGAGKLTVENGVPCFKIETTKIATEFYGIPYIPAKAGQTLEVEITAQGTGTLLASCYSYNDKKVFFYPGNLLKKMPIVKDQKVYKASIKLADGRKGEKLGSILLVIGASAKSNISIFDVKARIK